MIEEIIKADDSFSESTFLSNVDHIFIMILNSIQNNNMEDVRHYLANDVYVKFNNMINEYKNKNIRRCFDEMNVKSSKIVGNMITDNFITIEVELVSRYMDYFTDIDYNYISGINDKRIEKIHKITLSKRRHTKHLEEARRCTYCGNILDINNSGLCKFCRKPFKMEEYGYLVTYIAEI